MVQLRAGNFGGGRYLALASEQEAEPAINLPAGSVAGSDTQSQDDDGETPLPDEPAADTRSASTKAAEGSSAGGTTVSIAVYRSSFPIAKWDLNDDDFNLTKAAWDGKPAADKLPQQASPESEVAWPETGKPADYKEPTRAGFEFAGWSTDKSASAGGYIDGTSPKLAMPEGAPADKEYTLYALWTPNEYSVIFDLSKNPESKKGPGDDASFDLKWASSDGVRTVTDLGGGRYRVDGFTMNEAHYDKVTRTVGLPEPARSGYRFLGWSEPDGQNLAMDNADKTGFAMNPVRLTQIDGTPVLTARWTTGFGVTAPLSITFGDYDKTGAPGNPWLGDKNETAADDTTQDQQDKEGAGEQEGYAKGGHAFFENTGWHEAVKLVGITSTRHANANQVLTTYDSSKASEAQVLGDGTEANPGERLLSLYPSASAPADKSSGIHFRLSDAVDEKALGNAFTMAPQGETGAKKEISYGLNLATDPVEGTANHGLVLPTNDYERKQIATVSYTFATATAASDPPSAVPGPTGSKSDALWVENKNPDWAPVGVYGLADIKAASADFVTHAHDPSHSNYYKLFKGLLDAQVMNNGNPGAGPYFQMKVSGASGGYLPVQLIGICQDTKTAGGKAGLTFQVRDVYAANDVKSSAAGGGSFTSSMNDSNTNSGGWYHSALRRRLLSTFWNSLDPALRSAIAPVNKYHQLRGSEVDSVTGRALQALKNETVWLPSMYEVFGRTFSGHNETEGVTTISGYAPFQYMAYQGASGSTNPKAVKKHNGSAPYQWLRSAYSGNVTYFSLVAPAGGPGSGGTVGTNGVAPCFAI